MLKTTKEYQVQEFNCKRNDLTIRGKLYLPIEEGTYPAVILSHGFGGTYKDTERYAERLVKEKVGCYVFDFCGGAPNSSSDGDMTNMSVLTELEDLHSVVHKIMSQKWVKKDKIYLMGESQGGMVTALLAEQLKEEIAGVILVYPAFIIPDDARKRFATREEIPQLVTTFGRQIGKVYYDAVIDMDIWKEIGKYQGDVLIIHGTADTTVPVTYSEKAVSQYASARLVTIEGAGHGFTGEDLELATTYIKEYLKREGNEESK